MRSHLGKFASARRINMGSTPATVRAYSTRAALFIAFLVFSGHPTSPALVMARSAGGQPQPEGGPIEPFET